MTLPLPTTYNLLQAIAREEGFYIKDTRAQRNNNPGNIEYGKFTKAHGATGGDPRFAIFPTSTDGFACMHALFVSAYKGLTVAEAVEKWAPSTENDTQSYINNVCNWTGLAPGTVIDDHLS